MTLTEFQFLGIPHITAMILTIILPVALAAVVRKADSPKVTRTLCYLLGATLLANEVGHWGYRLATVPDFNDILRKYLSLHICGLAVFATALALLFRHQILYETAYFWGLVGTLNAIITPGGLEVGFPKYRFFQYFIAHSGIVVGVLFATLGLRMRPTLRSLFRSFLILNVYMVAIAGINLLLRANYMFICKPPDTESPFFFAPWPWYIPILDGVTFVLFFIAYSPFLISDWLKQFPGQSSA
jgi:hypothetical integral membrane protein (TIGR02206 family)